MKLLEFLNENAGALNVVFTAVVTIATLAYALLTWRLVSETRRLREVQTEPKIEVTVRPLDVAINIVRLHVRNIGLGPALDVRMQASLVAGGPTAEALLKEFTETGAFQRGIAYLSPGEERYSPFTQMTDGADGKLEAVLGFEISYRSATGRAYSERVQVSMAELKDVYQLGKPHLYAIAQSLEKIQQDVHHLTTGFKRLNVDLHTSSDRDEEKAERKRAFDALRKKQAGANRPADTPTAGAEGSESAGSDVQPHP